MGISSALYTGVSGLNSNGQAMTVIGNNLANTNTIAYKGSRTLFSDLLSSSISGSGGQSQVGRGVGLSRVDNVFSQGTFESTESGLDLAIEGSSFFILSPPGEESVYYSRAGAFSFNEAGFMVNPEGYRVQGIPYDADGELIGGNPSDIFVNSAGLIAGKATDALTLTTNLDSSAAILGSTFDSTDPTTYNFSETLPTADGTANLTTYYRKVGSNEWDVYHTATKNSDGAVTAASSTPSATIELNSSGAPVLAGTSTLFTSLDPGTITWPDATISTPGVITINATALAQALNANNTTLEFDYTDPKTFNYSASVQVFDSLGNPHLVTNYFRKTADNTWDAYYSAETAGGTIIPTNPNAVPLSSLSFGEKGQPIDPSTGFDLTAPSTAQTAAINWGNGSEAAPITITFDTTQFNSDSIVISQDQNGYGAGNFTGVSIDGDGNVIASYSNGEQNKVACVSLARFVNSLGLSMEGSNLFQATTASGAPRVGLPGPELGSVFTNSLEQSNVDMGAEFVKMITIQRGFQANSKIITTVDELLGELINLKR